MAAKKKKTSRRDRGRTTPRLRAVDDTGFDVDDDWDDVHRQMHALLATPLPDLLDGEDLRAAAAKMAEQAAAVPPMRRLGEVVAFVGAGRSATAAGNLKLADARALAERLRTGEDGAAARRLDDLPEVAHLFHWAVAAEFVSHRRGRIVPGPLAGTLADDPLSAWFKAVTTLISHGVLDGFRSGWRKSYIPLLDGSVPILLGGLATSTESVPVADLEELAWRELAEEFGIDERDSRERAYFARLVNAMFDTLADLGIVARVRGGLAITELGAPLGAAYGLSPDDLDDLDDLDDDHGPVEDLDEFIDVDAFTLVSMCAEMDVDLAWQAVAAWCDARPNHDAADELAQAVEEATYDAGASAVAVLALLTLGDAASSARRRLLDVRLPPALHGVLGPGPSQGTGRGAGPSGDEPF